jgi:hypothetical protein
MLYVGAAAAMLPEDAGWEAVAWLGFCRRWLLQFPVAQVSRLGKTVVSHTENMFECSIPDEL